MRGAVALRHAAAPRAVEADGVDLVEIGHRAVALGEVADGVDRRDVAVHRVDRLEGDDLGRVGRRGLQQLLEMAEIVVPPDPLLAARRAHAGDHGGVVEGVGEHDHAGQDVGEHRKGRLVRDVARGEQQRAFLAVQLGELALEVGMVPGRARDVARAARARAGLVERGVHRVEHELALAHAEVVVRAPHDDVAHRAVGGAPFGAGELAAAAAQLGEHPVPVLGPHPLHRRFEAGSIVHTHLRRPSAALPNSLGLGELYPRRLAKCERACGRRR